ncbi:response regulator [Criblamydia sequanensis]|uniref:Signal transduction response regulator n=1 Tax=Candidatus Criblamydia sequanensis CRIB-18 TaxID=1437425 RepID=A0A090CZE0_9BACT|nr:response regulator [Criblamydia sequanensis]CDR34226.1 Signal transduction response regulator [Criblamydia sequanensis CRIB-18]
MNASNSKKYLLISKQSYFQDLFSSLFPLFNAELVQEENEGLEGALLDFDSTKKDSILAKINSLKSKNPNLKSIFILCEPFNQKKLKELFEEFHPDFILPVDISSEEAKAFLRALFQKEQNLISKIKISNELLERYKVSAFDKIGKMEALVDSLSEFYDLEKVRNLRMEAHKLAGSGLSYGYKSLGELCRLLDIKLMPLLEPDLKSPSSDFITFCKKIIRQTLFAFQKIDLQPEKEKPLESYKKSPAKKEKDTFSIYLVTADTLIQHMFNVHAAKKRIKLISETDPKLAIENLESGAIQPTCLIVEMDYPINKLKGEDVIEASSKKDPPRIGIIISDDNLATEVGLVQKHFSFILRKPITESNINLILNQLVSSSLPASIKALIVDDDPDAAIILKNALQELHIEADILTDEKMLLATLQQKSPNIIFLDLGLASYSGWHLLQTLRSDIRYSHLIIVIYTGNHSPEILSKGIELGADDVLLKPLDFTTLNMKVSYLLRRNRVGIAERDLDYKTGFSTFEKFTKDVEAYLFSIPQGFRLGLVLIKTSDLDTLKTSYGEENISNLIQGLSIIAKINFKKMLASGVISEGFLALLIEEPTSGEIEFEFETLVRDFFRDIQIYSKAEVPIKLSSGACLFKNSSTLSFNKIMEVANQALSLALKDDKQRIIISYPAGEETSSSQFTPCIVIVDDDTDLQSLMTQTFEREGYQVISFTTGQEAIDYFVKLTSLDKKYILILDRVLSDMDGLDVLKGIKIKFPTNIHIIFLSSLSSESDIVRGFQEGAIDYVTKPFNLRVLLQKARALINL